MRDIGALFPSLNRDRFRQLIQLLGNLSGSILNNAEIARSLGVSEPTVRDWLAIAHGTYLWRHLPAWDRSPHKQLVRHPKGWLRDSGLLPVEIKLGAQTPPRSLRALDEFVSGHDCRLGLVINNDERSRLLGERIVSIPAAAL